MCLLGFVIQVGRFLSRCDNTNSLLLVVVSTVHFSLFTAYLPICPKFIRLPCQLIVSLNEKGWVGAGGSVPTLPPDISSC